MAGLMEVSAVNFSVLPPEINSLRMFLGAGSAPMLEASAAWSGLAEELGSAADSFSSVTTNLAGQAWQGPAAQAMARAARPYADFLRAASVRATTASSGAKSVASIFEAAKAATVHPEVIAANRQAFVQAVRTNIFGFNAPFIAAAEAAYEEFWATDVAAMVGYHGGASTVAAQLSSWAQTVQNLPGLGQLLGGAPAAAATAAPGDPNLGLGNKGGGNIGSGNNSGTGGGNVGNGNTGSGNFGSGNNGTSNIGLGNKGTNNFGLGNNGVNNVGFGNAGGTTSTRGSVGFGNAGNGNFGAGNTGNNNIGGGNTGNDNIGFGLTGNKLVGVGGAYYDTVAGAFHFDNPFANGNIGFGNSGHGNIGFFNSGDGNLGIFGSGANTDPAKLGHLQGLGIGNSGFGNIGFGNTGDGNFGTGNSGFLNTGFGNSGDMNTGGGNSGGSILSLLGVNPQPGNTGFGNSGFGNTGFGNAGNLNTGFFNGGNVNTGLFNSGNVNTGFNISTDSGLTHSGFNTVGTNVSGFNNSATGAVGAVPPATLNGNISGFGNTAIGANNPVGASVAGGMSGFFNTASGANNPAAGLILNGLISGFANQGVTAALLGILPSGVVSGVGSGLLNANTGFSAVFNIQKALAG
ncbi:PPE family protein [Mycobacterium paragordonae]|uniref:PPE family protein n=1 Tax=Mycobacterium paragordonae TaxID=1389713 RepID=UPI001E507C97|nr:PPE family protein [Mycobacterium paragordonae]